MLFWITGRIQAGIEIEMKKWSVLHPGHMENIGRPWLIDEYL